MSSFFALKNIKTWIFKCRMICIILLTEIIYLLDQFIKYQVFVHTFQKLYLIYKYLSLHWYKKFATCRKTLQKQQQMFDICHCYAKNVRIVLQAYAGKRIIFFYISAIAFRRHFLLFFAKFSILLQTLIVQCRKVFRLTSLCYFPKGQ